MSMPTISDINPTISIKREDAVNIIMASIAMEELALAHILNAEGEKLQYVLGTLKDAVPDEITICDIMAVNKSVQKTLRDVIKEEMLLQFKLEDVIELGEDSEECAITITGQKIWKDGGNMYKTRPAKVVINLLRDEAAYDSVEIYSAGDGTYTFSCLPVYRSDGTKYNYRVDEINVPAGYTKTVVGYNVINTAEPGSISITGTKTWADNNDENKKRPTSITVNLLQNGSKYRPQAVTSPTAPKNTVQYTFTDIPRFDNEGTPFVYTVDEEPVTGYKKSFDGYNITNTIE